MTPVLALTQRVIVTAQGERRDALDQRWHVFAAATGFQVLPVPNVPDAAAALMTRFDPAGLVLTGGNDLVSVGGDAPERDATELALVTWMEARHRPIMGVCRGAEFLADMFGGALARVSGHAGTRHALRTGAGAIDVNSYHDWGISKAPAGADAWAHAADGSIEAFGMADKNIAAIMWHPEREEKINSDDIAIFRKHFGIRP